MKGNLGAECNGSAPISQTATADQTLTLVVTSGVKSTSTAVTSSSNPSTYGDNPTFTATVTATGGNPTNQGTVTFKDCTTTLCSDVALSSGQASCTPTSALGSGNHSITADYSGTSSGTPQFAASNGSLTQTVDKKELTVTAQDKTITYGDPEPSFTFTYSGFAGTEGASVIDTAPTCSVPVTHTNVGSYDITCSGGVDNNYSFKYVKGTLTIVYGSGFLGIQQPINGGLGESIALTANSVGTGHDPDFDDDNSRFKLGSTVPVKFTLTDANGVPVTAANIANLVVKIADNKADPGVDETISTSAATEGNAFRLSDATTGQYIFNLSTKSGYKNPNGTIVNFTSQGTNTLTVLLNDGTSRSVNIQLVK